MPDSNGVYTPEEQKANVAIWLAALRSGEYRQGEGALEIVGTEDDRTASTFCCLGVACKVLGVPRYETTDGRAPYYGSYRDAANAPPELQAMLGLGSEDGRYTIPIEDNYGDREFTLIDHNDTDRYSFSHIADIIETFPAGLFTWSKDA